MTNGVDGTDNPQTYSNNFGHNFWTSSSKTATINFPASGNRYSSDGSLINVGRRGFYWSAGPSLTNDVCALYFNSGNVYPLSTPTRPSGYAVRTVADE